MKRKALFFLSFVIFCSFFIISCKKQNEKDLLWGKLKESIFTAETQESPVDSVVLVSVDSLSRWEYAGLTLESVESMKNDYLQDYMMFGDTLEDAARHEMELFIEEIQSTEDFYRDIYERNAAKDTVFLLYLVEAQIFRGGVSASYFYAITPDFVIHNDPFSENLLE